MKPRLLDLFCGAGIGADGYANAGWEVVGVDIQPQPHYPFEFSQYDALEWLRRWIDDGAWGRGMCPIDAIHASPPCQFATDYQRTGLVADDHENLIAPTRALLIATGLPYVLENVEKARPFMAAPTLLCGSMFDLDVRRHRLFETNWHLVPGWGCRHRIWSRRFPGATNRKPNSRFTVEIGVRRIPLTIQKRAMGVERDVTREELSLGIPPVYTEFIGTQLLTQVSSRTEPVKKRTATA